MTARAVLLATLAGAAAGFVAGRLAEPDAPPADDALAARVDHVEQALRRVDDELRARSARAPRGERAPESASAATPPEATPGPAPSPDSWAKLSDEEIWLAAQARGDDIALFKAALARPLPTEHRARLLVAKAACCHKIEWHGSAEREALVEAVGLVPTTTAVGAEASLALAYSYAAYADDRWRCRAYFESVLRDAPNEEQRMKGAYGLAWMHDLGDEPKQVAIDAYRAFLDKWGEKWNATAEASWARSRIALHEAAK